MTYYSTNTNITWGTKLYLVESDPIDAPSRFVLADEPWPPSKRAEPIVVMANEEWQRLGCPTTLDSQ